jgi:hypothetical protein
VQNLIAPKNTGLSHLYNEISSYLERNIVMCLAEYWNVETIVPKELGKGISGLTFSTATNMEIPW